MNHSRRRLMAGATLVGLQGLMPKAAHPATDPIATIRLIVPFAPGSGNDILGRLIAQQLTGSLGQTVVVDNRAGGGGLIGAGLIAHADPDGTVIGMGSTSTLAIGPARMKNPPYDVLADFAPISLLAKAPYVLVVNPSLPAHSLGELISLAKAAPGKLKFASAGVGTTNHLAGEILNSRAGIRLVHVPYRAGGHGQPHSVATIEAKIATLTAPVYPQFAALFRALGAGDPALRSAGAAAFFRQATAL